MSGTADEAPVLFGVLTLQLAIAPGCVRVFTVRRLLTGCTTREYAYGQLVAAAVRETGEPRFGMPEAVALHFSVGRNRLARRPRVRSRG
jgi:hypothetical protein